MSNLAYEIFNVPSLKETVMDSIPSGESSDVQDVNSLVEKCLIIIVILSGLRRFCHQ